MGMFLWPCRLLTPLEQAQSEKGLGGSLLSMRPRVGGPPCPGLRTVLGLRTRNLHVIETNTY